MVEATSILPAMAAKSKKSRDPRLLLAWVVGTILAFLVIPPIYVLLRGSFAETGRDGRSGGFTFDNYVELFNNDALADAVINSVVFAAGSVVLALAVGGLMAWIVERTNAPMKILAYVTAIVSMGTPYVLYIIAWIFLLGRIGPFNSAWRGLGFSGNLIEVNSMGGMILVEGFLWSPLVFLMLSASFRSANADLEEAARMSGAGVLETVWHVSLKLARPALIALALFVFIRAIEAFEVPLLVGTPAGIKVLTTEVYESTKMVPPDLGQSSAFSVILLVVVSVLFTLYGRISKNADRYQTVTGKGFRPRPFDLGAWRPVAGGFILLNFLIIIVLPIIALIWMAMAPFYTGFSMRVLPNLNFDNFRTIAAAPQYIGYGINTIIIAIGAATACVLLTALAAWIAARRGPGAWILDQLATFPLIFPGVVMGVAVLQIGLRMPFPIYGTIWLILFAYIIRYTPYGMRYNYSGVIQIHSELESAAGVAGASTMETFRRILAPLLSPSMIAGWIFIFLICAKELSVAVLLAGPNSKVLAVAMLDLWANGDSGPLAALGLIWTALMTLIAITSFLLGKRAQRDTFGD